MNSKVKKKKNEKGSSNIPWNLLDGCFFPSMESYEICAQRRLEDNVSKFRRQRYYGPECDKKTCIGSRGNPVSWKDYSSGVSWIGVAGTDTTCIISMKNQDELRRVLYGERQLQVENVLWTALADMGVWAQSSTSFRQRVPSMAVVPYAVVSVAPDVVVKGHLKISHELQEQASYAINFVEAKLKNWSHLSSRETIQIAVCALKYLLGPKFESDEIEVVGSGQFKRIKSATEFDEYLAAEDVTTSFFSCNLSSP